MKSSPLIGITVILIFGFLVTIIAIQGRENNISSYLISSIQTKTIPLDTFNGLSEENKKKFIDIGGQIDCKSGK